MADEVKPNLALLEKLLSEPYFGQLKVSKASLCWSAEDRRLWKEYVFERAIEDEASKRGFLHD
jgi:hypothetical protein